MPLQSEQIGVTAGTCATYCSLAVQCLWKQSHLEGACRVVTQNERKLIRQPPPAIGFNVGDK